MNNTRAAAPSTHAVSPASTITRGNYRTRHPLQRVRTSLAGADSHQLVDRRGPHLAITDLPGGRRFDDDVNHIGSVLVGNDDVEANLWHEVDLILGASIDLCMPLLAAISADLADREAVHSERL